MQVGYISNLDKYPTYLLDICPIWTFVQVGHKEMSTRVGHIDRFSRYHYGGLGCCLVTCGDPLYSIWAFWDYGKVFPLFSFDFESISSVLELFQEGVSTSEAHSSKTV